MKNEAGGGRRQTAGEEIAWSVFGIEWWMVLAGTVCHFFCILWHVM